MRKRIFTFIIVFILIVGTAYADIKNIKVSVDSLVGEVDLEDNEAVKDVSIVDQAFSDFSVLDMTISPNYITGSSSVRKADLTADLRPET